MEEPMSTHPVLDLGRRWAAAEQAADTATLDRMTAADFTLVGPFGFVLDKEQWLDRYREGDLVTSHLEWHDVEVREYGTVAVAIGVHTQRAAHRGRPSDGSFRATHIAVKEAGEWKLAGMHLSPLGLPEGPPRARQPSTSSDT
jgi:ketosteroid isomerase-like protein